MSIDGEELTDLAAFDPEREVVVDKSKKVPSSMDDLMSKYGSKGTKAQAGSSNQSSLFLPDKPPQAGALKEEF